MFLLSDIITYIRRIIKSPSNISISDGLLIDYINRFYINDVDARIQLFDLKKTYSFVTTPGVDRYNMPLYDNQIESPTNDPQSINFYPVYQGFLPSCKINGVEIAFQTQKQLFFNSYPNIVQNLQVAAIGDGGATYTIQLPILPAANPPNPPYNAIVRGHVDIAGIIATGNNVDPPRGSNFNTNIPVTSVDAAVYITALGEDGSNVIVTDSGQFLSSNINYGMLMSPGKAPFGNTALPGGYLASLSITGITLGTTTVITVVNSLQPGQPVEIDSVSGTVELNGNLYTILSATPTSITLNVDSTLFTPYISGGIVSSLQNVINYLTGTIQVTFPQEIPQGNNINVQVYFFAGGLPRAMLFYNNTITFRSVPAFQYVVELDGYMTPAAFLNSAEGIPYGYMSEYIARGAARKILSDTGDGEQLQFYEPMFLEQEQLVWKRSQRQWTATRTETIYSQGCGQGINFNQSGSGTI
jgi:hypothetical protein